MWKTVKFHDDLKTMIWRFSKLRFICNCPTTFVGYFGTSLGRPCVTWWPELRGLKNLTIAEKRILLSLTNSDHYCLLIALLFSIIPFTDINFLFSRETIVHFWDEGRCNLEKIWLNVDPLFEVGYMWQFLTSDWRFTHRRWAKHRGKETFGYDGDKFGGKISQLRTAEAWPGEVRSTISGLISFALLFDILKPCNVPPSLGLV